MRLTRVALSGLIAVALIAQPVVAQTGLDPLKVSELAPGQFGQVDRGGILTGYRLVAGECANPAKASIVFLERNSLDRQEATMKRKGMLDDSMRLFSERYRVSGCGNRDELINVMILLGHGQAKPTIGFPGTTRTSPLVQSYLRGFLVLPFANAKIQCGDWKPLMVTDTKFEKSATLDEFIAAGGKKPAEFALLEAWQEVWTVSLCGKSYEITAPLALDEEGGVSFTTFRLRE